jgi:UDP-3-O-acyl-N-acetylglucosamine deacetylase
MGGRYSRRYCGSSSVLHSLTHHHLLRVCFIHLRIADTLKRTPHCTTISAAAANRRVITEHLLAAFSATHFDNAILAFTL